VLVEPSSENEEDKPQRVRKVAHEAQPTRGVQNHDPAMLSALRYKSLHLTPTRHLGLRSHPQRSVKLQLHPGALIED
jgi:hypothetical protein